MFKEEIIWYDVNGKLPGDDDDFTKVRYKCLCQVELNNKDPQDDPEVTILYYDKDKKHWENFYGIVYDWGWHVTNWANKPKGPNL